MISPKRARVRNYEIGYLWRIAQDDLPTLRRIVARILGVVR